jgi:hypothetical protein
MEISAVAVQQAQSQNAFASAMLKKTAQSEQALVNLVDQAVQSGGSASRGQNLDITV